MKFKHAATLAIGVFSTSLANAYNNLPLSPSWFKNIYENITESRDSVWRGKVIEILNPTQVLIENPKGQQITVNLLHLTLKRGSTDAAFSMQSLEQLLNKNVYVLADEKKKAVSAKLIDATGKDINLNLVELGAFDINTTTLHFKHEKQQYINALNNARSSKLGIWK